MLIHKTTYDVLRIETNENFMHFTKEKIAYLIIAENACIGVVLCDSWGFFYYHYLHSKRCNSLFKSAKCPSIKFLIAK